MNYKTACEILEINTNEYDYSNLNIKFLTKKYHKLALRTHPDKNGNTPASTEKFKQINEAYNYLKNEYKSLNPHDFEYDNKEDKSSVYFDILQFFTKRMFEGKYNDLITKLINDIVMSIGKESLKVFDGLDKETSIDIYNFLSNHRFILHLNETILEEIREIILKKCHNIQIYKLNPSINDLLNHNIYKLYVDDKLFLVPLWYNESYFDAPDCEIIVICEPELNIGITIDDDNNIHTEKTILLENLHELIIKSEYIFVYIGDTEFSIPISELYMKSNQIYRIKGKGISTFHKDFYDVSEKSDIIVNITIV